MIDELIIYKKIEDRFKQYRQIKKAVSEYRQNRCIPHWFTSGHAKISDPTANMAVSNLTPLKAVTIGFIRVEKPELWISLYDAVKAHFDYNNKIISRYMDMIYMQDIGRNKICNDLYIGTTTYYSYRREIIVYATMVACQFGLVKIYE